MNPTSIDGLRSAIKQLEEFYEACSSEETSGFSDDSLGFRMKRIALIKAFEFNYELAVHFIRQRLSEESVFTDEKIKAMGPRDMLQAAGEAGLVTTDWIEYGEIRDILDYEFMEVKAEKILSVADNFLEHVRELTIQ